MAETHDVMALVAFGEADDFAGQGLADEYAFAAPSISPEWWTRRTS